MLRLVQTQPPATKAILSNADMDESALLTAIAEQNTAAFEMFYKIYYPRLYRFILRMTQFPDVVEELIQETLLVIWDKPHSFNHTSKISTWVFGIAYNKSLKMMSISKQRSFDIDIDELNDSLGDPLANPAHYLENADWLSSAMTTLSAEQRAVIELTFYHGFAYQEIAKILNCPENTVKTRMFHARKKLQLFVDTEEN
ncbi:RNA polymerase sigma factor [Methylomonas sp. AM2-LC]|uniref:RNA polymerase sigma factor n=1 Tax=Methylomonas sp. AM2-LC TaxID=3153301 RepID=UPI003264296D